MKSVQIGKPAQGRDLIESHAANIKAARHLPFSFDMVDCRTFFEMETKLRNTVTSALADFSLNEKPLEKSHSSWIWLRPNGTLVVEETFVKEGTRYYVDEHRDQLIAVFASRESATPDSRFHDRKPDAEGPYGGSVSKRWTGCPPFWRHYTGRMPAFGISLHPNFGARVTYRRFHLKPMEPEACAKVLRSADFQGNLKRELQAWLSTGVLLVLLGQQSFQSLKAALKENDKLLVTVAGGQDKFEKFMTQKAEEHLRAALQRK